MHTTSSSRVIGIAAPSYTMPEKDISVGVAALAAEGFTLRTGSNLSATYGHFAGEEPVRAEQLMQLTEAPDTDAVLMTRGGNGALRMLPYLDWNRLGSQTPWIGFSDTTALLTARYLKTGVTGWHAPMLRQLKNGFEAADHRLLRDILNGKPPAGYGPNELNNVTVLKEGATTGTLWGGNLGVLRSLCGTPWMPQPQAGDILFVEELDDDNWHIDRDLEQLFQAGLFDNLGGLVFGTFSGITDATSVPFGFTMREVFERHAARINGPVVCDFPVGHAGLNLPLPVGKTVTLSAETSGTTLTWEN